MPERTCDLDAICRTATALFDTPHAAICRIEDGRAVPLGAAGPDWPAAAHEAALRAAQAPLVVLDTHDDPCFANDPRVTGAPFLRFHAGVPVTPPGGNGPVILWIGDTVPRPAFGAEAVGRLADLGRVAAALVRARTDPVPDDGRDTGAERPVSEAAASGRWTIDVAAGTIVWSEGLARLLGRADWANVPLGFRQHVDCYHPSERAAVRAFLRRVTGGKVTAPDGTFTRQGQMMRPDGAVREVVVSGRLVRDAAGAVVAVRGTTLDVTDLTRSQRDLQAWITHLHATLEHMDQGLLVLDHALRVLVFNQRLQALLGLPDGVIGEAVAFAEIHRVLTERGDFDLLSAHHRAEFDRLRLDRLPRSIEWARPDGSTLEVRHTPLPDGGRIFTLTDISAHRIAERAVQESEHRFRLLAEHASDVIVLSDEAMRPLYVSPAVRSVLGYEPGDLVGRGPAGLVHDEDAHLLADLRAKVMNAADGRFVACLRYRHRAGHYVWVEASISLVGDARAGAPLGYVAALRDIGARRLAEEQVRHMALHDGLTGLPNRILFRDRLDQAVARAARTRCSFAVLACDLDRFKAINDSLGHPAGDALLCAVAARMKRVLRPFDTVARLGGDEFAVVLAYLDDPYAASCYAERLIAAVSEPIHLDGQSVEVGVSIGLMVSRGHDGDADELFKRADMALYEAKAAGRNTHREFEPGAGARMATRGQLGLDMKDAMRRGEFRLVYQPVIHATTGAVVSFESLMRWAHPVKGEISPGEFIPLAEETGLILPLGAWALDEACREAMHWPDGVRVAVNVSAVQLRQKEFEATVFAALTASGLPPRRLKLEVTESVLMQDADDVLAKLHRVRQRGVLVALDDFGTGYSSLSYLRRFPFDKIKLDRAFIRDIADPDAAAIVRAVVSIGERLGMGIVAEGVETAEQLELVRKEGCEQVQGFYFSRPLPAAEARRYVLAPRIGAA